MRCVHLSRGPIRGLTPLRNGHLQCVRQFTKSHRTVAQVSPDSVIADTAFDGSAASAPTARCPSDSTTFQEAVRATEPRNDWTKGEIETIYNVPLMRLAFAAVSPTV